MKRLIIILVTVVFSFGITSCGKKSDSKTNNQKNKRNHSLNSNEFKVLKISKEIFNDEWEIKLIGATANKEYISEDNFSVFEFVVEIQRKSFSVFIKIIIPLFIIMSIAFLNAGLRSGVVYLNSYRTMKE
jgi:membrane protein insertase Oxa1/YidC/SpoIIIJ